MSLKERACFSQSHSYTCFALNFFSFMVSKYCSSSPKLKCRIFFFAGSFILQRYLHLRSKSQHAYCLHHWCRKNSHWKIWWITCRCTPRRSPCSRYQSAAAEEPRPGPWRHWGRYSRRCQPGRGRQPQCGTHGSTPGGITGVGSRKHGEPSLCFGPPGNYG